MQIIELFADLVRSFLNMMASETAVAISATVSGLATFIIACLTGYLVRENRLLRKAGNTPRVIAHFEPHPDGTGAVNISLSNVGTGPAMDVSFSFERDEKEFEKHRVLVDHAPGRPPMTMIAQDDKISFIFAMARALFWPKGSKSDVPDPLKPFRVNVRWKSLNSKKAFSESYVLDISAFTGLPAVSIKPPMLKVADEMKKIRTQIAPSLKTIAQFVDVTKPEDVFKKVVKGDENMNDD